MTGDDVILEVLQRHFTVILLLLNFIKWAYFGRSIEALQSPLYMIYKTFLGMRLFLALVLYFSMLFSVMYIAVGIDIPGGNDHTGEQDFPFRTKNEKFLMYGFLISTGDISLAEYSRWTALHTDYPVSSSSMMILGHTINFAQIIF